MGAGRSLLHPKHLLIRADVRPGHKVVQFGPGRTGHFVIPAGKRVGQDGLVYAVSLIPEEVSMLTSRCDLTSGHCVIPMHGNYLRHRGTDIPDHTIDRAFLINHLYAVSDFDPFAHEVFRLLASDGYLTIVDWRPESRHPIAPEGSLRRDALGVERAFAGLGARVERFSIGSDHYGIFVSFS